MSTINNTVPREIGRNITDLVHTVVVGALGLVWQKVAAYESKGATVRLDQVRTRFLYRSRLFKRTSTVPR
jgi:hypothetical protein